MQARQAREGREAAVMLSRQKHRADPSASMPRQPDQLKHLFTSVLFSLPVPVLCLVVYSLRPCSWILIQNARIKIRVGLHAHAHNKYRS